MLAQTTTSDVEIRVLIPPTSVVVPSPWPLQYQTLDFAWFLLRELRDYQTKMVISWIPQSFTASDKVLITETGIVVFQDCSFAQTPFPEQESTFLE